jgi:hypothetical protein
MADPPYVDGITQSATVAPCPHAHPWSLRRGGSRTVHTPLATVRVSHHSDAPIPIPAVGYVLRLWWG